MKKSLDKEKIVHIALIVVALFSMVVSNVSFDAEYQLAMAYRMIKGDALITQMWEPHQTSAFINAIFMKLYVDVLGTTTGVVLYMQIIGLLIRVGISLLFYRVVHKTSGENVAFAVSVIYLLVSPKDLMLPEFSNLQVWFTTLMLLALLAYFDSGRKIYLILAAVSLCMGVLAYPSVIIVYIGAIWLLWKYGKRFVSDMLLFTGVCAAIGISFCVYLLWNTDIETLLSCLTCALAVEPSHTVSATDKLLAHLLNVGEVLGMLFAVAVIGSVVALFTKKKVSMENQMVHFLLCGWYVLMVFVAVNILSVSYRGGYAIPFVVVFGLGFWHRKKMSEREACVYWSGLCVGMGNLLATLILSDHAFIQAITYLSVVICVSVMPIARWMQEQRGGMRKGLWFGIHLYFVLVVFRCVYIHVPLHERDQIISLLDDLSIVRSGPAIGIISEEDGVARQRDSMEEWELYIKEGDSIWMMGHPVDTLGYLYKDVEVGAPTVMSTPTYTEALLYYYEINPEKYPDVIVVASSFGETEWELLRNEWLMNWLENEFCADEVIDGNYWKYYVKRR